MGDDLVIVPSRGEGFTELARSRTGRLFRKHILNKGPLIHPGTGKPINIDDTFVDKLKTNFRDGVCDIVQVPLADAKNTHSEDPERNIGEVIGIEESGDKVYVVIDARDDKHAEKLGKTYLGASAMMHLDYTDSRSGKKVGPTLLHACITNRPYVTGLDNYEEIVDQTVAATSDRSDEAVVLLSPEEEGNTDTAASSEDSSMGNQADNQAPGQADATNGGQTDGQNTAASQAEAQRGNKESNVAEQQKPTLAELFNQLKAEHGIDVPALQAEAGKADNSTKLTSALTEALAKAGLIELSGQQQEVGADTAVAAVRELASSNIMLTNRVNSLERTDAEHVVDALVSEGRVMPAKRETFVNLKLTNPALFDEIVPDQPIVKLNNEQGKAPAEDAAQQRDIDADIARYVELSAQVLGGNRK